MRKYKRQEEQDGESNPYALLWWAVLGFALSFGIIWFVLIVFELWRLF